MILKVDDPDFVRVIGRKARLHMQGRLSKPLKNSPAASAAAGNM